jgi:hypothetical protein
VTDESEMCETIACLAFTTLSAVYVGSILTDQPPVRECSREEPPDRWLGR